MTTTAQNQTPIQDNPNRSHAGTVGAPPSTIITRDGERVLQEELERLRHELECGMAERLREARAFGTPAGNDEYLQIQEEEIILAVRAARLDELLERAWVVGDGTHDGRAAVGTIVDVEDPESGELTEHELVGGHEALRANAASAASPIGQALLGREAGEIVEVHLPKGGSRHLEIVRVRLAAHALPLGKGLYCLVDVQGSVSLGPDSPGDRAEGRRGVDLLIVAAERVGGR
jgi:transcription elongation factor GreA